MLQRCLLQLSWLNFIIELPWSKLLYDFPSNVFLICGTAMHHHNIWGYVKGTTSQYKMYDSRSIHENNMCVHYSQINMKHFFHWTHNSNNFHIPLLLDFFPSFSVNENILFVIYNVPWLEWTYMRGTKVKRSWESSENTKKRGQRRTSLPFKLH